MTPNYLIQQHLGIVLARQALLILPSLLAVHPKGKRSIGQWHEGATAVVFAR